MERFLKSRYKIGDKISENPFSVTYHGFFIGTEKPVVIKIYKRGTLNSSLINRMKYKVKDLSHITYHGVARLIDGDYGWQGFYYVRPFIPGKSLRQILDAEEKLEVDKAVSIIEEVGKALEVAHSKGIIHGALKPSNIIVDPKGVLKVTDFVIEGEIKEAMPQKAMSILTSRQYLSPEELQGRAATISSDIYGLGWLLWEMVAGSVPLFDKETMQTLPKYLQDVLKKALHVDPLLRFASVTELRDSLDKQFVVGAEALPNDYLKMFE